MADPLIQAFLIPVISNDTTTTTIPLPDPGAAQPNAELTVAQMPWAGTIKRIWLGHSNTIGNGFVTIIRYPGGLVSAATNLPSAAFTGTAGAFTDIIEYDEDFVKDDGLKIKIERTTDISTIDTTITLEVEFTVV